jgi:high-affinity iron transporter
MTSTPSRNTGEGMEAILGIVAVVLMYVVGIWMHRRSNAQRWNEYRN